MPQASYVLFHLMRDQYLADTSDRSSHVLYAQAHLVASLAGNELVDCLQFGLGNDRRKGGDQAIKTQTLVWATARLQ